jgi:hypothetical protein
VTASRHVETMVVTGMRLGRRPHDPDRPVLRLADLLTGVVPAHPATVDHFGLVPPSRWGALGNNQYSDCGPADIIHDRMLVAKYLGNVDYFGSTAEALDLYKRSGNPGFPAEDNGVVMADMLSEVHTGGVGPADVSGRLTKCVAYAQVNVANLDEVRAAIAIFGALSTGADLQRAQQSQTNAGGPWDYSSSQDWGGHAFLVGQYTGDTTAGRPDLGCISWGMTLGITDKFWTNQVQEAWVVIWPEHLTNRSFLIGVDQAALAKNYKILTGRDLPVNPAPTPSPAPGAITAAQNSANLQLAVVARAFNKYAHSGLNGQMSVALDQWLTVWGLK